MVLVGAGNVYVDKSGKGYKILIASSASINKTWLANNTKQRFDEKLALLIAVAVAVAVLIAVGVKLTNSLD